MILLLVLAAVPWQPLTPGVAYAKVQSFHLVRIDPNVATFTAFAASEPGAHARTAAQWSASTHASVVFNAGMFEVDRSTHTGFFTKGALRNSEKWVPAYKSVLVQHGKRTEVLDVDQPVEGSLVVQNLRLIRRPGVNVWSPTKRAWSETALAVRSDGTLLVVFSRAPLTMHDFNERLLRLGLGVVAAMHLEGGPEASLSIHAGGIDLDLCGSYETGFCEDESNVEQWVLPNVFAVMP